MNMALKSTINYGIPTIQYTTVLYGSWRFGVFCPKYHPKTSFTFPLQQFGWLGMASSKKVPKPFQKAVIIFYFQLTN